jgi:hypothetical protein
MMPVSSDTKGCRILARVISFISCYMTGGPVFNFSIVS